MALPDILKDHLGYGHRRGRRRRCCDVALTALRLSHGGGGAMPAFCESVMRKCIYDSICHYLSFTCQYLSFVLIGSNRTASPQGYIIVCAEVSGLDVDKQKCTCI